MLIFCSVSFLKVLNKENLSWPQNFIQSYVTHKTGELSNRSECTSTLQDSILSDDEDDHNGDDVYICTVREEECRKLMRRNTELKLECEHLSDEDKRLCDSLTVRNCANRAGLKYRLPNFNLDINKPILILKYKK